jgi:hypothetical protein
MPKIKYQEQKFRHASLVLIQKCEAILQKYHAAGYDMTLRQLYYQLVAADEIPNKKESYDNLGVLVTNARLGGYLDWSMLVDRTRGLRGIGHYENPEERIKYAAYGYAIDKWKYQKYRPEVWIEKEALAGVFSRICNELDVPYFSCKGYSSASSMWGAGMRFRNYQHEGKRPVIFHFGDHDPSGIDMTRDITERLELFMGGVEVDRLALTMEQVEEYQPPPNPTKILDSRAAGYIDIYGHESWELDALDPDTLADLVRAAVLNIRDEDKWAGAVAEEQRGERMLHTIADNFNTIETFIEDEGLKPNSDDYADDESDIEDDDDE